MNAKTFINRIVSILVIAMMLFAALPVIPAGAASLNIASVKSGTWEATAWPNTPRSGTISVTAGNSTLIGTGTAFLTELSVGNIIKTTTNIQVGTVASIASDTQLTLSNVPATTRTNIPYNVQGVGPADNVTIASTHIVTIAANAVNQTGTVTVNSGGTLTVSHPGTTFSTLIVSGLVSGDDDIAVGTLTVNNGGTFTGAGNGAYTAASLTIDSGGTVNMSRAFTVSGATTISGAINFSSTSVTARAMVFAGPVTLNNGATWTEPATGNGANNTYDFQDSLTNNASTFTTSDPTSTATHTFSGAGKTIGGTSNTSIGRVIISGTYTNNGILSVGNTLSGTGALTNSAVGTLNMSGPVSITTLTNAGTANKLAAGPISTALANFTNTGTLNLNGSGTVVGITNNAGGTVNLISSGLVNDFDNATATSTLNIVDTTPVPHFTNLLVSVAGNTVNYSGPGDQIIKPVIYSNLILSGSGNKSITMSSGSTLTTGNLSIAPSGTAKANVTGLGLVVNSITLGNVAKLAGTWGSTASVATNKDDTFFTLTTGYFSATVNAKTSQTINFTSTAPAAATVGGATYTPTATATSGLPVTLTIDGTASSVCSISAGVVSFHAAGTCVINANQGGNGTFLAAPQVQQSFAVGQASQTISFTSTAPAAATVGGSTYTPSATATSGLPVTFTIDATASSVCSITAGVVSFTGVGTCVVNANQAGNADYLAAPQVQQSFAVAVAADRDTTGVFRPSNGLLFLKNSNTTGIADAALNYGLPGDYPVVGDWDGNGTVTIGIYRGNTFFLRNENTLGFATIVFDFGQVGDQPIAGDWDGDGVDTIGVFRPSTAQFLLRNSNDTGPAESSFFLGNPGDVGVAGDWTGKGFDTTGVFRPSNGVIFLKNSNDTGIADIALNYGLPGDQPVMGDWDNDGKDTIGIYRNATFFLRNENTNGFATLVFGLGNPGDMPIAGNWDNLP
jgi:large repetitive protein